MKREESARLLGIADAFCGVCGVRGVNFPLTRGERLSIGLTGVARLAGINPSKPRNPALITDHCELLFVTRRRPPSSIKSLSRGRLVSPGKSIWDIRRQLLGELFERV
jgi:hypothetical protein